MRDLQVWQLVMQSLEAGEDAALLIVVDSKGSSPGRQGFKMAVTVEGRMAGSIGGGIMEHKLVEMAIDRLDRRLPLSEVKRQIHSKEAPQDQSGMICSGEQTIAMLRLDASALSVIADMVHRIRTGAHTLLVVHESGIRLAPLPHLAPRYSFVSTTPRHWSFSEAIGSQDAAHVIGAGHVGLEMCRVLSTLDFHVTSYDDRPNLNTMLANTFAHQKHVTPYTEIGRYIPEGDHVYVIVMTFGYRGDDEAIRALLGKKFKYFGMMGSEAKISKLLGDLRKDGFSETDIAAIHTPAGLVPHCKTPAEIAVSVAAEMIALRNAPPS